MYECWTLATYIFLNTLYFCALYAQRQTQHFRLVQNGMKAYCMA